jgi:hypothetical protein
VRSGVCMIPRAAELGGHGWLTSRLYCLINGSWPGCPSSGSSEQCWLATARTVELEPEIQGWSSCRWLGPSRVVDAYEAARLVFELGRRVRKLSCVRSVVVAGRAG